MTEQEIDTAGDNPVNFPEDKWEKWQQEHNNSFVYQVQRGRLGHNRGLENGLIRINNSIYGTHQGRYYLIGADSGVGKTTVSDFMFVLKAWQSAKKLGRRIKIFYCSFEISKLAKQARWCSHFIFLIYGVELPASYILGNIPNVYLTDEHMAMVKVGSLSAPKSPCFECFELLENLELPEPLLELYDLWLNPSFAKWRELLVFSTHEMNLIMSAFTRSSVTVLSP